MTCLESRTGPQGSEESRIPGMGLDATGMPREASNRTRGAVPAAARCVDAISTPRSVKEIRMDCFPNSADRIVPCYSL